MKLQKIRLLSKYSSLVTALIGSIALIGWIFHIEFFSSGFPGLPPMRVNAALGLILSGISLWFCQENSYQKFKRSLSCGLAIVVAGIALLTLIQFLFNINLGIDELLIKDYTARIGYIHPGRMAATTALNFLLVSLALILLNLGNYSLAQGFAFGSFLISLLGLTGYIYQVQDFYDFVSGSSTALNSIIAFCILSLGILFAHPEQGWLKVITSPYAGGITARSLLPFVIGLPLLMGSSLILSYRYKLMPIEVSIISRSTINIVILGVVTWWNARFLNKLDLKQRQTELELRQSHEQLENRVAERTAELTNANNCLLTSYQLLESVIEGISDAVFVKDSSGRYVLVNSAMSQKLGKSKAEILGFNDDDLFAPETAQKFIETDCRIMKQSETQVIEEEILEHNQQKTFLSTKSPWLDSDRNVIGVIGVIKDITERKQTEAALKYREWLARFFIEHTSMPAAVFDNEMRYLIVSQRWLNDYRLGEQDIIGRSHYEVFPEIPQCWKEVHQRCLAGAVESCEEDPFPRADGTVDWLRWEVRPWYDETGAIGGIIMFTEVITARKEAEFALKQSEQRYANLASVIPVGVYRSDTQGYINYVNRRWCELSGLSAEQAMGKGWENVVHPEDRDRINTAWEESVHNQSIFCTEYRYQRPDGAISWVYGQAVAERAANGEIIGYIGTVTDITERKRIEQDLQEAKQRVVNILESMSDAFVAVDRDWQITYVNQMTAQINQMPPEELIGKNLWQGWFATIGTICEENLRQAMANLTPVHFEYFCEPRQRWYEVHAYPSTEGLGIYYRDITERQAALHDRQQAEAALQASEEQLRLTLEFAQIGNWAWYILENRVTWNSKIFQLLGLDPNTVEASHNAWRDRIHPDDLEQVEAAIYQALLNHTDYEAEYRVIYPDGSIHWLMGKGRGIYDRTGQPVRMLGVIIDITERQAALHQRQQAEAALQASEEQLRLTLEFTQIGSWDWHIQENRIIWNHNHFQLLGLDPKTAEVNYEIWRDRIHPDDIEGVEATIRHALLTRIDYDTEYRVVYPNGSIHWRMAKGRAIYDRSGQPVRMLGVIIDINDRKQAEEALQASEEQLRLTLEFTQIGSWDWHIQENLIIWNHNHFRLLGLDPKTAEVNYEIWRDCIHPDDIEGVEATIRHALLTRIDYDTEYRVVYPNGSIHWRMAKGRAIYDRSGQPVRMLGVIIDINDRKQAEIDLRESEERLRLALQATNQGFYDLNVQTGDAIVSAEYTRILGYELEELQETNAKWRERLHPEERETVYQVYADYIAGKRDEYRVECRQKTKTGEWKWILSVGKVVEWDKSGKPIRILGTHTDISDRKQTEAALLASEKQLRSILENMPVMLDAVDADGNIIVWNQECERVTGYSAEEIMHNPQAWEKLYPEPIYREKMLTQWLTIGHNYRNWEWNLLSKNGEIKTIAWSNISEFFPVPGWTAWGVGIDISERKKAEIKIIQLNQTLEQRVKERTAELAAANQELEAFSYSVSHDLRAPLRGIDGFSKVLLERYANQLDEQGKHYLDRIRAGTQRMGELIEDMLMLSRVTRADMKRVPVNLSALAQEISENLSESQPQRSVQWNIAPEITVLGDAALLRIVLENLLSNAWKFTSNCTQTQIEFGTTLISDNTPAYFIRDNGVGFDMTYVHKLFIAFQRLHSTNDFPGTGVGLAIVQRIIHRHGGKVWAEGIINQGAIFYFSLE
ncbi:PAS domain S-box protein [Phormidium sp. LEGE 05292]|uniref:PAS domain-containing sensor histidine kinase n=1 Tax=[Phormidium] sp. LEGE 05292 TaxID=767427 RepID=UPI00188197A7|nr:PAS domain S-box protein [Phormidium sp. LEGE 05292]MBE9224605.1 PAS domain S-box protein [Phormidium sp. LEGE 05292]